MDASNNCTSSRPSLVDVFKEGNLVGAHSSKMQRTARALQWRQIFQNKDMCEGVFVDSEELHIVQVPNPEETGVGTGGQVWPAAVVLLKYIEKRFGTFNEEKPESLIGKKICELGSGTGIVGIACSILGAKSVTVTDQVNCFPLIQINCQRYFDSGTGHIKDLPTTLRSDELWYSYIRSYPSQSASDSPVTVDAPCDLYIKTYEWGENIVFLLPPEGEDSPKAESSYAPFDMVLVSDCILPKLYPIEPLVDALSRLLAATTRSGKSPFALISYEHRPYPDYDPRDEFERLAMIRGLRVTTVPITEHHRDFCCDDIEIWEVTVSNPPTATTASEQVDSVMGTHAVDVISFGDRYTEIELRIRPKHAVDVGETVLTIAQEPNQGVGCYVWPSAVVVSRFLLGSEGKTLLASVLNSVAKGDRGVAVELGAGCGLCALVMHHLGLHVIASDVEEVVPLLKHNFTRNLDKSAAVNRGSVALSANGIDIDFHSAGGASDRVADPLKVFISEFDWLKLDEHGFIGRVKGKENTVADIQRDVRLCRSDLSGSVYPELLVCSDLIYCSSTIDPLHSAISKLSGPDTTILLCNEMRTSLEIFLSNYCSTLNPVYDIVKTVELSQQDVEFVSAGIRKQAPMRFLILKKRK